MSLSRVPGALLLLFSVAILTFPLPLFAADGDPPPSDFRGRVTGRCGDATRELVFSQAFQRVQARFQVGQREHHQVDLVIPVHQFPEIGITWCAPHDVAPCLTVALHLFRVGIDPDEKLSPGLELRQRPGRLRKITHN